MIRGRIVRFVLGGASAAALNVVLLWLYVTLVGSFSVFAATLIALLVKIYTFLYHERITWRTAERRTLPWPVRIALYYLGTGLGLTLYAVVLHRLVSIGVYYLGAAVVAASAAGSWNFAVGQLVVWRSRGGIEAMESPASRVRVDSWL